MKKFLILASLALILFAGSDTFAQCCRQGRFAIRRAQRANFSRCYQYAPSFNYYGSFGPCNAVDNVAPCGPFQSTCEGGSCLIDASTVEPCQAVEQTTQCAEGGCAAFQTPTLPPCEPVQTSEDVVDENGWKAVPENPSCSPCGSVEASCISNNSRGQSCRIAGNIKKAVKKVVENIYLAKVNAVRARYGLCRLAIDKDLDAQCANHCMNMAVAGYIFHAPACGYEIVASNNEIGIEGALQQWQQSPGHAAILLNPNLTRCGVQTYRDSFGRNYCAMRFR